jgi:pyruvate/2-oxoglutarate dehydrogenase complex dihydrolipoamide acyltransferase (E2) component
MHADPDADGRGSIAIRPMTYLCMSWDHCALGGPLAAQFLSTLKRRIEDWQGSRPGRLPGTLHPVPLRIFC